MPTTYPRDLTGLQFGYWKIIRKGQSVKYAKCSVTLWECLCTFKQCNVIKFVRRPDLISGRSTSCGCFRADQLSSSLLKHGNSIKGEESRLYRIWKGMKSRCKPSYRQRKDYYDRGISLCQEWDNGFQIFLQWSLKNGYDDSKTIDRIDNNLGYCPENCRWVSQQEQSCNTRRNRYFEYEGETKHLSEWARDPRCKVKLGTLKARVTKYEWPFYKALTTPTVQEKLTIKIISVDYIENKIYLSNGKIINNLTEHPKAPLYRIWDSIKQRCSNPNNHAYKNYGGRGIKICQEWNDSFEEFKNWAIKQGYHDYQGWSIDRINVNESYLPQNCRLIKREEQVNNRRVSRLYTYAGETKSLSQWAKDPRCRVKRGTLRERLELGWDFQKSLLTPCRNSRQKLD
ncbi:MAG: hypothetical protein HWQ35_09315 [Nostoc sp. NMS1]|uniref:hypothetical protein n=1 Tax=unclassified Nostoc TaxID=2593658 RepID=UPI0015C3E800|nr:MULTISPECIES: hypothetical protein [unclassified Nostoc]MBN3906739.1 hypothetical protein [Nostoc sp. NMS1]QLE52606.1 hypothetical protein FD724_31915 [Nostoc sp. C057]